MNVCLVFFYTYIIISYNTFKFPFSLSLSYISTCIFKSFKSPSISSKTSLPSAPKPHCADTFWPSPLPPGAQLLWPHPPSLPSPAAPSRPSDLRSCGRGATGRRRPATERPDVGPDGPWRPWPGSQLGGRVVEFGRFTMWKHLRYHARNCFWSWLGVEIHHYL